VFERALPAPRFESLREELSDRRAPVEALLVEVGFELRFEVLGDPSGDGGYTVCYVYVLYRGLAENNHLMKF